LIEIPAKDGVVLVAFLDEKIGLKDVLDVETLTILGFPEISVPFPIEPWSSRLKTLRLSISGITEAPSSPRPVICWIYLCFSSK
jgi:hypothetical protein